MNGTSAQSKSPVFISSLRLNCAQLEAELTAMDTTDFEHWMEFLATEAVLVADDAFRDAARFLASSPGLDAGQGEQPFWPAEERVRALSDAIARGRIRKIDAHANTNTSSVSTEAFATRSVAALLLDGDQHGRRAGICMPGDPLMASLRPLFASSCSVTAADPYLFASTQREGAIALVKACLPPVGTLRLVATLPEWTYRAKGATRYNPNLWDKKPLLASPNSFWRATRREQTELLTARLRELVDTVLVDHLPSQLAVTAEIWLLPDWQTGFHDRFISFESDNTDHDSPAIGVGIGRGLAALAAPHANALPTIVCRLHQSDLRFAGFSHDQQLRLQLQLRAAP